MTTTPAGAPVVHSETLSKRVLAVFVAVPILYAVVVVAFYWIRFSGGLSEQQDAWGQFGDYFGGLVNPFVSLVTLVMIAFSLRYTVHALDVSTGQLRVAAGQLEESRRQFERTELAEAERKSQEEKAERESRTLRMHQAWIATDMQQLRVDSLEYLHMLDSSRRHMRQDKIFIGRHSESDRHGHRAVHLKSVLEFLADLYALLETRAIDEKMTWRLFGSYLERWESLVDQISFDHGQDRPALGSDTANIWLAGSVCPLFDRYRQWKATGAPT